MKTLKLLFPLLLFLTISSISFIACSKMDDLNLDSALFGEWLYKDSDGIKYGWTFNDDGKYIQTVYNTEYDWKWKIEETKLKLYVDGGTPTYKTYKVEGNKLYFWVDSFDEWSLPFVKQ